jgi:hypothetical protein
MTESTVQPSTSPIQPPTVESALAEVQLAGAAPPLEELQNASGRGSIAAYDDPLVSAVSAVSVLHPDQYGGHSAPLHFGTVQHFARESFEAKAHARSLQGQLDRAQSNIADLREEKATLVATLESKEKSWEERLRQIVGGGLMGAAFKVAEFSNGLAVFVFVLGFLLSCARGMPLVIEWITKKLKS